MSIVKHFKVTTLPTIGEPNSYYLLENGNNAEMYVTTETGEFHNVGNTAMINALIAQGDGVAARPDSGEDGYLPKFQSGELADSRISDDGTTINFAGQTKTTVQNAADVGYLIQLASGQQGDAIRVLEADGSTVRFAVDGNGKIITRAFPGGSVFDVISSDGGLLGQINQNNSVQLSILGGSGIELTTIYGGIDISPARGPISLVTKGLSGAPEEIIIKSKNQDSAVFDDNSTAGNTRFLLYDVDKGALVRVSVGAPASGGAGFKCLRVPN